MPLSILLMTQTAEVIVRTSEPSPANPWRELSSARCGRQHLEVRKTIRPRESRPEVLLNGRPPRGDLRSLEQELGQAGAAYRMSFTCAQSGAIGLLWVSGYKAPHSPVRYRAGSAHFQDGSLVRSSAEESTEETYWYR